MDECDGGDGSCRYYGRYCGTRVDRVNVTAFFHTLGRVSLARSFQQVGTSWGCSINVALP